MDSVDEPYGPRSRGWAGSTDDKQPDERRPWRERHPLAWRFLVGFAIGAACYCIGYAGGRQDRPWNN